MRMNYAEIRIKVKYFFVNTTRKTYIIWFCSYQNVYILIDHYTILFDNERDNYDSYK